MNALAWITHRGRPGAAVFCLAAAACLAVPARAQEQGSEVPAPPQPGVPETAPMPVMPLAPEMPAMPEALPVPEPELTGPEPEPESPQPNRWRYIIIHHSATPSGSAAKFNALHRRKGWDGLAYHFVITNGKGGVDGGLEVSPRWWSQKHGAHAGGLHGQEDPEERNSFNEFGIGICLVGNFEQRAPTRNQIRTLAKIIKKLQGMFNIADEDIVGHRHVKSTACPGRKFPWRTLFAQLGTPHPQHLYRRPQLATLEKCPWCEEHALTGGTGGLPFPRLASRRGTVAPRKPPVAPAAPPKKVEKVEKAARP